MKPILDSYGIGSSIINTKMPSVIFLANQKNREGERADARSNDALFQHLLNHVCHDLLLTVRVTIRLDIHWGGVGQ